MSHCPIHVEPWCLNSIIFGEKTKIKLKKGNDYPTARMNLIVLISRESFKSALTNTWRPDGKNEYQHNIITDIELH